MIWDAQQMTFYDHVVSVTYAVHCEQQSQDLCVLVDMKQQHELGSAAYCIIILAEMDSAPCAFGQVRPTPCDGMTGMAVSR